MRAISSVPPGRRIVSWILKGVVIVILVQTLFFKFSGAPESIYIFSTIGQEPWGRYGSGVIEAVASVLLLLPRGVIFGALLAVATMTGAIAFHLTRLGIVVHDDGGLLFVLAWIVLICAGLLVWVHRRDLPFLKSPSASL
ncbi:MAG TPA: DoxX family protein [Opitutaceae bacterium]|nr:DoxX family protein [Opitutaceae bacterium]